jgi:AcrR family transcriptional regulator
MSCLTSPADSIPARRAPRRLGAPERRQQLVNTALKLFAERGYRATTMEDIAAAAGVTKPLLYQHFDSKRALYLELVHAVSDDLVDALRRAYKQSAGPRDKVERGFVAYFEVIASRLDAFRLLFGRHAPDDVELSGAVRQVEASVLDLLEAQLPETLEPAHRRLVAHAIMGMSEGGTRFWVEQGRRDDAAPDSAEVRRVGTRIAALSWNGLRGLEAD